MHETGMRSQEQHEIARFANSLEKKIAIFYFCQEQFIWENATAISLMTLAMHETCIRSQEQHEIAKFTNSLEKKIAIFYFCHELFI